VDDLTLDTNVMYTVVMANPPVTCNPDEQERCRKVASWFQWDGANMRLKDQGERLVVPICQRALLVA
jgi:hypothetical protein